MSFFSKIFGDPNAKVVRGMQPIVDAINAQEAEMQKLSDDALRTKTNEFRQRLGVGNEQRQSPDDTNPEDDQRETLDEILPEAFAVVREASRRVLGQRHFDEQLMGGIVLHRGGIAEMRTGEGKTLTATLAVYLNALSGKGVHVITVNDYLARRDAVWMGRIYHALGLTVGSIQHETAFLYAADPQDAKRGMLVPVSRKEAYAADITYGTNNEFGFDYLRDHMVVESRQMAQPGLRSLGEGGRPLSYAIIDEVDSILIDEARTPLIISAPAQDSTDQYARFAQLVRRLAHDEDYNIDEKMRAATLTESGIKKMEQWLGVENIYTVGGISAVHHIEQALRAEALFKRDRDYVVKEGEVIIVDEFTGRLMPGRRYSEGLHQAIEAKEGVKVQRESDTLATITFQNYFRMYEKFAGMTGTAATEAEEFHKIYALEVTVIPTHRPMVRVDAGDRIYRTENGKYQAVTNDIKQYHERGQPVLVGTISIEKNEVLSEMLDRAGIPHAVLNAKQHEKEAHIIAEAGRKGGVTIATNMAGRGVDIVLGGAPPDEKTPEGGGIQRTYEEWKREHDNVLALGGLHVIGTERHESRRIDNQLRGRAGRQGDPGSTQFYVSLDDDLMRIFGSDRMKSMMSRLGVPDDMPIEHRMITRGIEAAQRKVEAHHFDVRKHLLEYDDVLNKHREVMYKRRTDILMLAEEQYAKHDVCALRAMILGMVEEEINSVVAFHTAGEDERQWNLKEIYEVMGTMFPFPEHARKQLTDLQSAAGDRAADAAARTRIIEYCITHATEQYQALEQRFEKQQGVAMFHQLERQLLLRSMDTLWVEHLDANTRLREGIGLRGYGQRDPLVEYKREAYRMFQELLSLIRKQVVYSVFKIGVAFQAAPSLLERQGVSVSAPAKTADGTSHIVQHPAEKIGRNDPCPCGATRDDGRPKKYKNCHGA